MPCYSICLISDFPRRHVVHVETARAAQITARLLAERFPGMAFGFGEGPDCRSGECHPSIRDSALSTQVQRRVEAELMLEADANPCGLPKWCAFQYRDGGVCAYHDHDLPILQRCRQDIDMVQERAIFSVHPTTDELLDCFRTKADLLE